MTKGEVHFELVLVHLHYGYLNFNVESRVKSIVPLAKLFCFLKEIGDRESRIDTPFEFLNQNLELGYVI